MDATWDLGQGFRKIFSLLLLLYIVAFSCSSRVLILSQFSHLSNGLFGSYMSASVNSFAHCCLSSVGAVFSVALLQLVVTSSAYTPPVYEVETFPSGSPPLFRPHQGNAHPQDMQKILIAEFGTHKFCTVKNNIREYFAGSDGIYSTVTGGVAGPATSAIFNSAFGVWADTMSNIFVSDGYGDRIRKVSPDGQIIDYAGNGIRGQSGDGGQATSATINYAVFVSGDVNGNLFVSEFAGASQNSARIRQVSKDKIISTAVGGGTVSGDGTPATSAGITGALAPFINSNGDIFWTTMVTNKVQMVSMITKKILTIAGGGSNSATYGGLPALSLSLNTPWGIWGDDKDNIFFTEQAGNRVVVLSVDSNYQNSYKVADIPNAISVHGDTTTGKLYVVSQRDIGAISTLTDPLFPATPFTLSPSASASMSPSGDPTTAPSAKPTPKPTDIPTRTPSASPSNTPTAQPTVPPSIVPSANPSPLPSMLPSAFPSEAPTLSVPEYSLTVSAKSFKYFEVRVLTEANERVFPVSYNLVDCPENAGAVIWGHESTPITEDTNTCVYGLPRHYWCECLALENGNKPKLTLNFGETVFDRVELLILDWVDGEVVVSDSANNIVLFSASRAGGPLVGEEFVGYDHLNLLHIAPSVVPTIVPSSVPTTKPSWTPTTRPSIPSIVPTQTPTVVPTTTKPSAEPSVVPSMVPSAAPSFTAQYTITLTAKTFKYFEVRVYTHDNLRIFPVSYELEHCPENAGSTVWNDQTTEDTNTCVYGYPRNFWCACAAVADAKPKLVLHMGHTVFDRVELLLLNWEDGEVTVTDEANHETFLSATHDGVGNEFVTFGNLNLEHAVAPVRRLLRGA